MQFFLHKKGFTLIEMLIVIVIIGILAAALVPRLQDVQSRARDTKRKADLRTIYNANEIYFLDNSTYLPKTGNYISSNQGSSRTNFFSGILTSVPVDPINRLAVGTYPHATGNYAYGYGNATSYTNKGWTYDLYTILENPNDPERCELNLYKGAGDAFRRCGPNGILNTSRIQNLYDISPNVANK